MVLFFGRWVMKESNIDDFDKTVGLIFATLYQAFPIRKFIDPQILSPLVLPNTDGWEERYHHHKNVFTATMTWLIDAGYLWASPVRDERNGTFLECVLSTKGLEILNMPSSLGPSIGSKLGDAVTDTAGETLKDLAKEALSAGATLAAGLGRSLLGG